MDDPLSILDWVMVGLIIAGAAAGLVRGLARELARTCCYVLSAGLAWSFCYPAGILLQAHLDVLPGNRSLLAFILILIASWFLLWIFRLLLRGIGHYEFTTLFERGGGGLLGLVKNTIALFMIMLYLIHSKPGSGLTEQVTHSRIGRWVQQSAHPVYQQFAERHPDWYLPPTWDFQEPGSGVDHALEIEESVYEQGYDRGNSEPQ